MKSTRTKLYSTLNPNLRIEGDELRLLFSYTPETGVEPTEAPCHALPSLKVERRHGVLGTRLALGPAAIAIMPRTGSAASALTESPILVSFVRLNDQPRLERVTLCRMWAEPPR